MIRRSPAEYYIKYLLLHPEKYGNDDILRIIQEHALDCPGEEYLDKLRASMRPPRVFHPFNDMHSASFRFLVGEKVHKLFFPDRRTKSALELLNKPRAKELVETMVIVREPHMLIVRRLQNAGLGTYKVQDIERYVHFFWNIYLVDSMELHALVLNRVENMQMTAGANAQSAINYKSMKRAQFLDPRYSAVTSALPLAAAIRMQVRSGVMPDRVSTARLAEMAATLGTMAAAEAAVSGHPKASQDYANFSLGAHKMKELQDLLGSPDGQVMKELQQMAVETTGEAVPHIDELTGGDYTEGMAMLTEGEHVQR